MENQKSKTVSLVARRISNPRPYLIRKEKNRLKNKLEMLIEEENAVHFLSDLSPMSGIIAAETVLKLREKYPHITLECVLPYEEQAAEWRERVRNKYFHIIEMADTETLLSTHYSEDCMKKCAEYMTGKSDFVFRI